MRRSRVIICGLFVAAWLVAVTLIARDTNQRVDPVIESRIVENQEDQTCELVVDILAVSRPFCIRVFMCPERLTPGESLCFPEDINGDGVVDLKDFQLLQAAMGEVR